jgi:hypothetical protein
MGEGDLNCYVCVTVQIGLRVHRADRKKTAAVAGIRPIASAILNGRMR